MQELFKDIELSPEEVELALFYARRDKAAREKMSQYTKRLFEPPKTKLYTAKAMYELANKTFDVDETNKNVIWKLCLYFTGESGSGLDLNKGIYLYGPIGCGKTELMKWFKHNQTNSFVIFDVRQISDQYKKEGSDGIYRYKGMIESAWMPFGQSLVGICFDDLGTEVDSKHYGNEANVIADVFLSRYQNKNLHSKTHFTTNLNASMLKERYGDRVASRLREMVNIVEFPDVAIDRRK